MLEDKTIPDTWKFHLQIWSCYLKGRFFIVVFVNIDNKDQYIYLLKNNFFINFSKVVDYGPVLSFGIGKKYFSLKFLVPLGFFVSPNNIPFKMTYSWMTSDSRLTRTMNEWMNKWMNDESEGCTYFYYRIFIPMK